MATNAKVFIDTNVLLRANIASAPFHNEALEIINQLWDSETDLWISRQVLREYLSTVSRPQIFMQPLSSVQLVQRIADFQTLFHVADETAATTAELLNLLREFPVGGKQIHDANIVATMLVHDIDTLVTQNIEDFKRFSGKIGLIPLVSSA